MQSINRIYRYNKIGYPLTLAEGISIIGILKEKFDFKVICDYKVADIDATNSKICNQTFKAGADAIICHGFVGSDSVQACFNSAKNMIKNYFYLLKCRILELKSFYKKC